MKFLSLTVAWLERLVLDTVLLTFRFVSWESFEQPMVELAQVSHRSHLLAEMFEIQILDIKNVSAPVVIPVSASVFAA